MVEVTPKAIRLRKRYLDPARAQAGVAQGRGRLRIDCPANRASSRCRREIRRWSCGRIWCRSRARPACLEPRSAHRNAISNRRPGREGQMMGSSPRAFGTALFDRGSSARRTATTPGSTAIGRASRRSSGPPRSSRSTRGSHHVAPRRAVDPVLDDHRPALGAGPLDAAGERPGCIAGPDHGRGGGARRDGRAQLPHRRRQRPCSPTQVGPLATNRRQAAPSSSPCRAMAATARGLDPAALHGRVLPVVAAAMLGPHVLGLRDAAPELTEADGEIAAGTFLDLLGLAVSTSQRRSRPVGRSAARALAARRDRGGSRPAVAVHRRLVPAARHLAHQPAPAVRGGWRRADLHKGPPARGGAVQPARSAAGASRSARSPSGSGSATRPISARLFRARYGLSPSAFRAGGGDLQDI